jgi:hypothetical protein
MSISSVPWTRSLGLSGIKAFPLTLKGRMMFLILIVKGRQRVELLASGLKPLFSDIE